MKKYLPIISFLLASNLCLGQVEPDLSGDSIDDYVKKNTCISIETPACFPGGEKGLWCFIDSNLNKKILNKYNIRDRVYVRFRIDTMGIPTNFTIPKSCNTELDSEFLRVLKLMPKWTPAKQFGKTVVYELMIPLSLPYTSKCH